MTDAGKTTVPAASSAQDGGAKPQDGGARPAAAAAGAPTKTKEPENLLNDDGGKAGDGKAGDAAPVNLLEGDGKAAAASDAPAEKDVAEFVKAIAPENMGEAGSWDGDALKAIAPGMMKAGLTKEQAGAVVKEYAGCVRARAEAQQARRKEYVDKLAAETRSAFGDGLKRACADARRGGEAVFGTELWKEIAAVPEFANDQRVISALARVGRSVGSDRGVDGKAAGSVPRSLAERWYATTVKS